VSIATLDAALTGVERLLLDSSALIAFHERQEVVHPLAVHVLRRIESAQDMLSGCFSVLSASELLVRPIRAGTEQFTFMDVFLTTFPHLTVLPVDLAVAMQAATLRAVTGIRLPDALVIASGLLAGCQTIVSNDKGWKRRLAPLFKEFRWIHLGDHL
jgi:predicted nucleic acid-binding protein